MMRYRRTAAILLGGLLVAAGAIYAYDGLYGLNLVLRHGAVFWTKVGPDDPRLSPAMRLALATDTPAASAGPFSWQSRTPGFETSEMPVLAGGSEVDRLYLARLDPRRYRLIVRTAPAGNEYPADWLRRLHAVLIVNGSYYGRGGVPATPVLTNGSIQGPSSYQGGGVLTVSPRETNLRPLVKDGSAEAFAGNDDGIVSNPLLVGRAAGAMPITPSRWLANRSFIGEDRQGRIVIGTTKDAFFSLSRLAAFLEAAPLDLTVAMNLDGGPVACQAVSIADFRRDVCGKYELREKDGSLELLHLLYGRPVLPVVLAAIPREATAQ
jgi:hypothetical protein